MIKKAEIQQAYNLGRQAALEKIAFLGSFDLGKVDLGKVDLTAAAAAGESIKKDVERNAMKKVKPRLMRSLSESLANRGFADRLGLSGGDLTVPELLRSGTTQKVKDSLLLSPQDLTEKKDGGRYSAEDVRNAMFRPTAGYDPVKDQIHASRFVGAEPGKFIEQEAGKKIPGYLRYATPQNVNRAAALGGILSGGIAGGNTLKSYGASTLGSLGGLAAGGLASEGINKAIDAAYGKKKAGGAVRRIALDTLLGSLGASAGGYYAGKSTR